MKTYELEVFDSRNTSTFLDRIMEVNMQKAIARVKERKYKKVVIHLAGSTDWAEIENGVVYSATDVRWLD